MSEYGVAKHALSRRRGVIEAVIAACIREHVNLGYRRVSAPIDGSAPNCGADCRHHR